eukprot:1772718-Amphidinium_carterae.1
MFQCQLFRADHLIEERSIVRLLQRTPQVFQGIGIADSPVVCWGEETCDSEAPNHDTLVKSPRKSQLPQQSHARAAGIQRSQRTGAKPSHNGFTEPMVNVEERQLHPRSRTSTV